MSAETVETSYGPETRVTLELPDGRVLIRQEAADMASIVGLLLNELAEELKG